MRRRSLIPFPNLGFGPQNWTFPNLGWYSQNWNWLLLLDSQCYIVVNAAINTTEANKWAGGFKGQSPVARRSGRCSSLCPPHKNTVPNDQTSFSNGRTGRV